MMKLMRLFKILPLLAIAILPLTAAAQSSNAEKLLESMNYMEQASSGFEAMMPIITNLSKQWELNTEEDARLVEIYRHWFRDDLDHQAIMKQMAAIYSENFTDAELADLMKFYETPLGKKLLAITPRLTQEGARIGMAEATSKQQLLMNRLTTFLAEVQKRKSADATAASVNE